MYNRLPAKLGHTIRRYLLPPMSKTMNPATQSALPKSAFTSAKEV